ncbi:hypothetical protein ACE6H2_007654 [Prunus campanulata]
MGIFLGNRKQPGSALHMDVQIVFSSPSQLLDGVYNHCIGDSSALSMDIFSGRK